MRKKVYYGAAVILVASGFLAAAENPFLGRWALTPASGGAGWLEVRQEPGYFDGALLWMGGSPELLTSIYFDGDTLHALRVRMEDIRDASGAVIRKQAHPITITASVSGDIMNGVFAEPSSDSASVFKQEFSGQRIPALPPAPDLSTVRLGEAISLFNGRDLDGWSVFGGARWASLKDVNKPGSELQGWTPTEKNVANGWSVRDGMLVNDPVQQEGQPHIAYGNLVTDGAWEDFNLTLEVNVPPDGNSGIYLRGIYEVQVVDSFGKAPDCHTMGAIYGRIEPIVSAEKPAGEWQTLDITLADRHVTVKLNGQLIVDNQPLAGCTGGALWSDESRAGPVYLQGDHTAVQYRNIVLRPLSR